ncbi:rac GTPase-activating protein 1 [Aethina tumida]|uniref:rac GTPase-activating protein 1 n=1 Tax=Aethina tumida TaxID=116153 RepID=UPI0021493BCB|nr:rac GTPase-activating protein 1 [Aethina tumida]
MSHTPFKTPYPYTPKHQNYTPAREKEYKSDSEESTSSAGDFAYNADLSIVAVFDDLMRMIKLKRHDEVENIFLSFAENVKDVWQNWQDALNECRRLNEVVDNKIKEINDLESSLKLARKMFDKQKNIADEAQLDKLKLEHNLLKVQDIFNEITHQRALPNETKEKVDNITEQINYLREADRNLMGIAGNLSAIKEINSTGSLLSDLNYTKSEDDLDENSLYGPWKKHRPSTDGVAEPAQKKRRSSGNRVIEVNAKDTVRATTTLTVEKNGPITATSIIESIPDGRQAQVYPSAPPADLVFESWAKGSPQKSQQRQHVLHQRQMIIPDTCGLCQTRIRFGKTALKCKDCKVLCHLDCKDKLPKICVPVLNTPTQKNMLGVISDYTPTIAPMVPGILIHCINEIELRGLSEIGLYRIPGSERDVKMLKERFLKGKSAPILNQLDIHVVCGALKDFLRSLSEPIVTFGLWKTFVSAIASPNRDDVVPALYQAIAELPQPNRDTLAYLILHLKKVAESKVCQMPISNLAKVFGPTVVGYSCEDPNPSNLINETRQQVQVMEALMLLPTEFWSTFINTIPSTNNMLRQTPSTDSLLRNTGKGVFTPNRHNVIKRKRFFNSPTFN